MEERRMMISVEISMYPLSNEYKESVLQFLDKLYANSQLQIETSAMSTFITGHFSEVMPALNIAMHESFKVIPASFVLKVSNGCLSEKQYSTEAI